MKNKFFLIMFVMLIIGGVTTSNALQSKPSELELEKVDYMSIDNYNQLKYCVGCGGKKGNEVREYSTKSFEPVRSSTDMITVNLFCEMTGHDCETCKNNTISFGLFGEHSATQNLRFDIKYVYNDTMVEKRDGYLYARELYPTPCQSDTVYFPYLINESEYVHLEELGFYVHNELLTNINDINDTDRVFFLVDGEELKIVLINTAQVDIYTEVMYGAIGDSNITIKYGLCPFFKDADIGNAEVMNATSIDANSGNLIASQLGVKMFLVCTNHAKCKSDGCANLVASDGSTFNNPSNDSGMLNDYCANEHSCGFFWSINNGGNSCGVTIDSRENLECRNLNENENMAYCVDHLCHYDNNCALPVIGANMHDGRSNVPSVYQGYNGDYYSKYCVEHFCWDYLCTEGYASNPVIPSVTWQHQIVKAISTRCIDHFNCTIGTCPNEANYEPSDKCDIVICEFHAKQLEEGTLSENLHKCTACGNEWYEESMFEKNGGKYCPVCQNKAIKNGGYLTTITPDGKEVTDSIITSDDIDEVLGKLSIDEKIKKYCVICGKNEYHIKDKDGDLQCVGCMKEVMVDGDTNTDKNAGDTTDNSGNSGGGNSSSSSGGSYDSSSSGGSYDSSSSGGSYDSSTTVSPTQCIHANYPVPNTVTFSNITGTTHLQVWVCTNCNSQQSVEYEHTYIKGFCVCGYEQDLEKPEVELLAPSDLDNIKAGDVVRIKLTDNKELKSVSYQCSWSDSLIPVTKEFTGGTIQELEVGTLPNEAGEYTLLILEVADNAGNKLTNTPYIFKVVEVNTEEDDDDDEVDTEEEDDDDDVDTEEDDEVPVDPADTKKPVLVNGITGKEVKDNQTVVVRLEEKDDKLTINLSDNKELASIRVSCLWEDDTAFKDIELTGTKGTLTFGKFSESGNNVLFISELKDAAGNKLENIIFVIELPKTEEDKDSEKPKIELMTPQNLSELVEGAKIKIKFSDNKMLDKVNYTVKTNQNGSELVREEEREFNGAISQDLELATLETASTVVTLEIKLLDKAGNIAQAKYTFKTAAGGKLEVEGEGDAGFYVDDSTQNDENNDVEYEDTDVSTPTEGNNSGANENENSGNEVEDKLRAILLTPANGDNLENYSDISIKVESPKGLALTRYSVSVDGVRVINGEEADIANGEPSALINFGLLDYFNSADISPANKKVQVWIYAEDLEKNSTNAYFSINIDENHNMTVEKDGGYFASELEVNM